MHYIDDLVNSLSHTDLETGKITAVTLHEICVGSAAEDALIRANSSTVCQPVCAVRKDFAVLTVRRRSCCAATMHA